jgi:hypothetical protein
MILGLDAHAPSEIIHDRNDVGYKLAKELNMEVVDKLDIEKYKKNIKI